MRKTLTKSQCVCLSAAMSPHWAEMAQTHQLPHIYSTHHIISSLDTSRTPSGPFLITITPFTSMPACESISRSHVRSTVFVFLVLAYVTSQDDL